MPGRSTVYNSFYRYVTFHHIYNSGKAGRSRYIMRAFTSNDFDLQPSSVTLSFLFTSYGLVLWAKRLFLILPFHLEIVIIFRRLESLTQCHFNVGQPSAALAQQ